MIQYFADLIYGSTKYAFGGLKPWVVWGCFSSCEQGQCQKVFFNELLAQGFRRTIWQLIFPGQIAGLVKKIPSRQDGIDEYHIRFYDDGTIDCELEVSRFNRLHWSGTRQYDIEILKEYLRNSMTIECDDAKEKIKKLFGEKSYAKNCLRSA